MNKELLKELNEERKELGISKEDFLEILALAIKYQSIKNINEEEIEEIIKTTISNYDSLDEFEYSEGRKSVRQSFMYALYILGYEYGTTKKHTLGK